VVGFAQRASFCLTFIWNAWRRGAPSLVPDLSGADVRGKGDLKGSGVFLDMNRRDAIEAMRNAAPSASCNL
jgi:hypothetical protein